MAGVNLQFGENDSQKLILIAMTVIVIAALVERYSGVKETASLPQIFIGAFVATAILLVLSYILPEFAVGLALVAAVTMILTKGEPFWAALANLNGKTSSTPSTPNSPLNQQAVVTGTFTSQPLSTPNAGTGGSTLA